MSECDVIPVDLTLDQESDQNETFMKLSTNNEWAQSGVTYHPRTRADKVSKLPSGVYSYQSNPMSWWLERESGQFEFPFKVYEGGASSILKRVQTYWSKNNGNLGILMNGLRGAGKTMTAQLLGNALIKSESIPVLVVRDPIPLQRVFNVVNQPMMVIFDEFEKTHDEEAQQRLLSTIDGMSRNEHKRLFVFTTNQTSINENFRDRPSRIHYKFEFARVDDAIIEGLIDDTLPSRLMHFKSDIFDYLGNRKICTIDIVKAVISEVMTFEESPLQFEGMLNVEKALPPAYKIEILDPRSGAPYQVIDYYFQPRSSSSYDQSLLSGNKRSLERFKENRGTRHISSQGCDGETAIILLEKLDEDGVWAAKVKVPRTKTFYKEYSFLPNDSVWLENKPKDFKFPFTPDLARQDPKVKEAVEKLWDEATSYGTLYAAGNSAVFHIRITPNRDPIPSRWNPTSQFTGF